MQFGLNKFHETTYTAHIEQMSLNIRYVDMENDVRNSSVKEDFIEFNHLLAYMKDNGYTDNSELRLTGEVIGKTVTAMIIKHTFDIDKCVGIGTDMCSMITLQAREAAVEVAKTAVHAVHRVWCGNPNLNLCLSKISSARPSETPCHP